MPDYYDQQERLKIDPKRVMIFTIKKKIDNQSKTQNYYVRIRRKHGDGYFQKSLKSSLMLASMTYSKNS